MSQRLDTSAAVTEPWNTNFQPQYQLQFDVQQFNGQLGGAVWFKVSWPLSGNYGKEKLVSQTDNILLQIDGNGYKAYVSTLNALLVAFNVKSLLAEIPNKI